MTVYTVTNNQDTGPGSLRAAITSVNDDFTPDTIDFAIGTGQQRIALQTALPPIRNQVTIDGTTQPGYSTTAKVPQIVIVGLGSSAPGQVGLTIEGANNSIVEGLAIIDSGSAGLFIQASGVGVYSNYFGIDPTNAAVAPNGGNGISLFLASNNTIGAAGAGNLIAGNDSSGISLTFESTQNLIQGNAIGTSFAVGSGGSGISLAPQNIGNKGSGISLTAGSGNSIGGSASGSGNIISGNAVQGIDVEGDSDDLLQGNTIGLDAKGVTAIPNGQIGISLTKSTGDTIGGTSSGAANLISGNVSNGIEVSGGSGLLIQGNTIGLAATGETAKANGGEGILIEGSAENTIGGSVEGAGNLISGNSGDGIGVETSASTGNLIQGNTIGIDLANSKPIGNGIDGIYLAQAPGNTIGGTSLDSGNLVSGNGGNGIEVNGANASKNLIQGNVVGTNSSDSDNPRFGNAFDGIDINGSANNTIGGTNSGAGNVLVLNQGNGVHIQGGGATGNLVVGNHVGTDRAADPFLGNFHTGVNIESAPSNTIGGTTLAARNFIVSNQVDAIDIQSTDADSNGNVIAADDNLVEGNDIGISLDASGNQVVLQNVNNGLFVVASHNTIGGTAAGAGNVISENNSIGITIGSLISPVGLITATGNVVQGNIIGLDNTGMQADGNGRDGIQLIGAIDTLIGGTTTGAGNVISGNTIGMEIFSPNSGPNVPLDDLIEGNIIGLAIDGKTLTPTGQTGSVGNTSDGIIVEQGAEGVTIGGSTQSSGNVISGNGASGINFESGSFDDAVEGNIIGLANDGKTVRANNQSGVLISEASTGITIGGSVAGSGNIISGNSIGITVTDSGTDDNVIEGNTIGLGQDGSTAVGNLSYGLLLLEGVSGNTIGGTSSSSRNIISANGQGIGIVGPGSSGNIVEGNYVGLNVTGSIARGNLLLGIFLNSASGNTIGGSTTGAGNVISGNSGIGIQIYGPQSSDNDVSGNLIGLNASGSSTAGTDGLTLGNSGFGIQVQDAPLNTIGGSTAGSGNVISGNRQGGIDLNGSTAALNVIEANLVGLDATGSEALGNLADGIQVVNAPANVIGGISPATRNVISGNIGNGVEIDGAGSLYDEVVGNDIGTDASGLVGLGNTFSGVFVNAAPGVTIGGTIVGLGNVIASNGANGVQISGQVSAGTVVLGNRIGVDALGNFSIGNAGDGVLFDGTTNVTVGGTVGGSGNVISGNLGNGVEFGQSSSLDVLQGNLIGTDSTGVLALPNAMGVFVNGSTGDLIGGTVALSGNLISGNTGPGVHIFGIGSTSNAVEGNRIGTNLLGNSALPNQAGVFLDEAPGNVVAGNVLSGNSADGVVISGTTASSNLVQGNVIGLDATGSRAIGSNSTQQSGVLIDDAPSNVIGGSTPATRNVISGNTVGVVIAGFDSQGNLVLGNIIGLDAAGSAAVANGTGVYINGSSSNTIGGVIAGSANVISGNTDTGVLIYGTQSTKNLVASNLIGTDATGSFAIRNTNGIFLQLATSNTIGGSTAALGNLISGNSVAGIYLYDNSTGNTIERNRIGVSSTGKRLGNLQYGILLYNSASNTAPTSGAGANTIANSGIGNFREFTGPVPSTSSSTSSTTSAKSTSKVKSNSVSIKSVHPTGPSLKLSRPGSASKSASTHRSGS
jgi:parallel beta-helix repeat protein